MQCECPFLEVWPTLLVSAVLLCDGFVRTFSRISHKNAPIYNTHLVHLKWRLLVQLVQKGHFDSCDYFGAIRDKAPRCERRGCLAFHPASRSMDWCIITKTMIMERRIKLKTLNNHITCKICRGYLIDATTVTECLHTCKLCQNSFSTVFGDNLCSCIIPVCKSCLVKHLEENNTCPTCNIVIHQSHPLQYISFDRTMQDIVYKLVPELQKSRF